eukprot:gb/GEZN01005574.1/.p1 GENE.gb/GEZN01005574.1/~~gb/GEZN01005574.1/.p1  ORF type:complete len:476 (+),score=54.88 gb/GEZN01005574.1/:151-1578(+)
MIKLILLACVGVHAAEAPNLIRRNILGKQGKENKEIKASKESKGSKETAIRDGKDGSDTNIHLTPDHFSGLLRSKTPTDTLYEDMPGLMNIEYNIPMKKSAVFPIGSNTKLFTAVGIYQLQEAGHLNVNDDVADHLDQTDFAKFGFPEESRWCPYLFGDDTKTCKKISFVNMLAMQSGMIEVLNCGYDDKSPLRAFCNSSAFYTEIGSVAAMVGGFIHKPLQEEPGTIYTYSNVNFIMMTYLIEKYSGRSFAEYLETRIFGPMGMQASVFDPQNGRFGMIPNRVSEYIKYYDAGGLHAQLAVGSCSAELDPSATSGTGGAMSTLDDIAKFYFMFFDPALLGAPLLKDPASWHSIISRKQVLPPKTGLKGKQYYSQGVVTYYANETDQLPAAVFYQGGTICCFTANFLDMRPGIGPLLTQAWRNNMMLQVSPENFEVGKNAQFGMFQDRTRDWVDTSATLPVAFALHQQTASEPLV